MIKLHLTTLLIYQDNFYKPYCFLLSSGNATLVVNPSLPSGKPQYSNTDGKPQYSNMGDNKFIILLF